MRFHSWASPCTIVGKMGFNTEGLMSPAVCQSATSVSPNPSGDNLAAIFGAVRHWLKLVFDVHTIEAA